MSKHRRSWPDPPPARLCPLPHADEDGNPLPREAGGGMAVCWDHRRQLTRDVHRLPDLHEALGLQLHPDGPALQPFTTGQGETAAFVNERAANLRAQVTGLLAAWTVFVADHRKLTGRPYTVVPATLSAWLARHVAWMTSQDWAAEPVEHFHELAAACYAAAYPTGRHRVVCGRCLEVTSCDVTSRAEVRCPGQLVVEWTEPADLEPEGIDCTVCGKSWPHRYWSRLGRQLQAS